MGERVSDQYGHKTYQDDVLASLRTYLQRCAETNDPGRSFREVTEQLWGQASDYRAVTNLPEGVTMPGGHAFPLPACPDRRWQDGDRCAEHPRGAR